MDAFLTFAGSPAVAVLVLLVLALEAVLLLWLWQFRHTGLDPAQTLAFLGAGAAFSICLYAALSGAGAIWIATGLVAAFLFHILDLFLRWKG